jgi:acetylornithine deacetylase/succinyl-diaminopimelate desuccinylase-like protein
MSEVGNILKNMRTADGETLNENQLSFLYSHGDIATACTIIATDNKGQQYNVYPKKVTAPMKIRLSTGGTLNVETGQRILQNRENGAMSVATESEIESNYMLQIALERGGAKFKIKGLADYMQYLRDVEKENRIPKSLDMGGRGGR